MSTLCEWSDIQKVVYVKRLFCGSAKLFVTYEKCTKTWKKLKSALKEEFFEIVDSHAVHKELPNRKKSSDETYQAYICKMLETAAQANVETRAVIQYIIDGIQDEAVNKAVLYGARTIKELKEKFIQYETMKKEARSRTKAVKHQEDRKKFTEQQEEIATKNKRCFNCGSKEHVSKECPSKDKGTKCFNCNKFGHIASGCADKKKDDSQAYAGYGCCSKKQFKNVKINDVPFSAIIDTVADLSLISEDCHKDIGSPELKDKTCFEGIGAKNTTKGYFEAKLSVDGELFNVKFHVVNL